AAAEECEEVLPRERGPVFEAKDDLRTVAAGIERFANVRRWAAKAIVKQAVEATNALEAGCERDVRERQPRVVQELLCQRKPLRLRVLDRRDAELRLHRAAEMT